jgi:parallel beta-helix repeat protein
VKNNATLTIKPGVTVRFEPMTAIEAWQGGSIVAVGTADSNIVFTSNSPSPTVGSWAQVGLTSSPVSSFGYCVFEYATVGLYAVATNAPIDHCSFRTCQTGIWVNNSSPTITSCEITDCTIEGIRCRNSGSSPIIDDCNISNPAPGAMNIRLEEYNVGPIVTIDATDNWWGTDVEQTIKDKIYDYNDSNGVRGLVNYLGFLHAPGVESASWGSIKALFKQ